MSHNTVDEWRVSAVPAFQDNYLWILHDSRRAVLIDPGDAAPVTDFLHEHELQPEAILCTHHHADHIGGVGSLCATFGPLPVLGPASEAIPGRTQAVQHDDRLTLSPGAIQVLEVPGHTIGHVAYLWQDRLFCGDTLFALGCGRVFEGTPAQMYGSVMALAELPGDWWVHCAHEYTLSNLAFALHVDGANPDLLERGQRERARRAAGEPTVPSRLSEERRTNPFLRAAEPALRASAEAWTGARLDTPESVFAALREWKNSFRG